MQTSRELNFNAFLPCAMGDRMYRLKGCPAHQRTLKESDTCF